MMDLLAFQNTFNEKKKEENMKENNRFLWMETEINFFFWV